MVELQEHNRDNGVSLLLDVSKAGNSAQACQLADEFALTLAHQPPGVSVDINAGDLLLTRGVMTKLKQQINRTGAVLGTLYATVPQTQQAALDEGLYVKEKLVNVWQPIRQPLPSAVSRPSLPPRLDALPTPKSANTSAKVDLPDFSAPRTLTATAAHDFEIVTPQYLEIPELATPIQDESVLASEDIDGTFVLDAEQPVQEIVLPETGFETLYVRHNLRSGQTVKFNGNVVIVGDVHAGSEITAGGDILVWGELRGIAHAGAQGNYKSEIRAMKIEALQLRIADYIARRPDRIYYHKDGAESLLSPELARVADGEIKIFKTTLPKG